MLYGPPGDPIISGFLGQYCRKSMKPFVTGSCFLGGLCGALVAVRRNRAKTLFAGLCVAAAMFLLSLLVGAIEGAGKLWGPLTLWNLGAFLVGGIAAGLAGARSRRKRRT